MILGIVFGFLLIIFNFIVVEYEYASWQTNKSSIIKEIDSNAKETAETQRKLRADWRLVCGNDSKTKGHIASHASEKEQLANLMFGWRCCSRRCYILILSVSKEFGSLAISIVIRVKEVALAQKTPSAKQILTHY